MDQQRTIWTIVIAALVVVLVGISVMAFQSNQTQLARSGVGTVVAYKPYRAMKINFSAPNLPTGRYALWAVDKNNQAAFLRVLQTGEEIIPTPDYDLHNVTAFFVTIESQSGEIATPGKTIILQTKKSSGLNYDLSFPVDLGAIAGSYQLSTPTNGDNSNETSGVWFNPPASLGLTVAPEGWVYSAWLLYQKNYLLMGAFSDPKKADDLATYSGPRTAPAYPGEDFLTNNPTGITAFPLDLSDGKTKVIITLQPVVNNTEASRTYYDLPLLQATIAADAKPQTLYTMQATYTAPSAKIKVLTK